MIFESTRNVPGDMANFRFQIVSRFGDIIVMIFHVQRETNFQVFHQIGITLHQDAHPLRGEIPDPELIYGFRASHDKLDTEVPVGPFPRLRPSFCDDHVRAPSFLL
jgi:hypothetical protein